MAENQVNANIVDSEGKLNTGVFIFSWDFELAWGFHDLNELPHHLEISENRDIIFELINILEKNQIPSTWATVGHLFLESCNGHHAEPHHPTQNWYDSDPKTNLESDPNWYGSDIVDKLSACRVEQEIGCHTFSHVTTDVPSQVLRSEVNQCRKLSPDGVSLQSFVSPRNFPVPKEILRDAGFQCYREPKQTPGISRAVGFYSGLSDPPTGIPTRDQHDLWEIPTSTHFFYEPVEQLPQRFPGLKLRWFKSGLKRAIQENEVFHIRAHPHDFMARPAAVDRFNRLIEMVSEFQRNKKIVPLTMVDLANRMEKAQRSL